MNKFEEEIESIIIAVKKLKPVDEDILELKELCKTLQINITKVFIQRRNKNDINYYVGKGKIHEIKKFTTEHKVRSVIINEAISNNQRKNIEDLLKLEVLDRNEVILKIFSLHAKSFQSKLQVELAQLKYKLPRLIGKGKVLSRTGGGIGTLGPGETRLEYDRRKIRERISVLKRKLSDIEKSQSLMLKKSRKDPILKISLVGYTSAGKSTLLKSLTSDKTIYTSENLFSTLSTLSRRVVLPSNLNVIFSDTVGFIRNLPVQLVESFKSTLSHINYSDLVLIIVDVSDENFTEKMQSVLIILNDIIKKDVEKLLIFNKIDKLPQEKLKTLSNRYPNAYFMSAINKNNAKKFLTFLENYLISKGLIKSCIIETDNYNQSILNKFSKNVGIKIISDKKVQILAKPFIINKIHYLK